MGVVAVQQLSVLPGLNWAVTLLILIIFFAFLRYWRLMFFVVGVLHAVVYAHFRLLDRLPGHLEGQLLLVEGKITGLPQSDERKVRFDFLVSHSQHSLPKKIRLNWYFPDRDIMAGQTWRLTVKLKKPKGRYNPDSFDYERWLFIQNIRATGYVRNKPMPILLSYEPVWINIDNLRQRISGKLDELNQKVENIALIKALTIGDRQDINNKQWDVLRKTGTVHLLAISGLHIGLVSALAYFLVIKIAVRVALVSPQRIAVLASISVAIFYAALAGFSLPTQRALIMLAIVMMAISWQRHVSILNTLSIALLLILIVDPLAVLSAGFWLSFLAVALIVYCLAGRLVKVGYWESAVKIHCATAIGLAPVLLFYFQQTSVIAPVANLLAVPVISLIVVPFCLLAVVVMLISNTYAAIIISGIDTVLQLLYSILYELAKQPFASFSTSSIPFYAVPLGMAAIFILLAPRGMPARWLGLILLLPLSLTDIKKPLLGEVKMTLLDVGQGLAIVVETQQHILLFDTGAKYSDQYDMGEAVIVPFLRSKGVNSIDTLLISHGDNDHIGGAESVIKRINVKRILTSVPDKLNKYSSIQCEVGQQWQWDQVKFEILAPGQALFLSENNNSCVLKISSKHGNLLLTGDIEKEAEEWLIDYHADQLASKVLIAPHHGSNTSSSLIFLKQVRPEYILISSGYKNRYSFPHKQVLERYKLNNSVSWNTSKQGAIRVELKNGTILLNSSRFEHGKYWNM